MASIRGTAAASAVSNSDTGVTLPAFSPAAQVDDTAVVWVAGAVNEAPTYNAPAGWTLLSSTRVYDPGTPGVSLEAWWKRLTSADLASSTWGWSPAHGAIVTAVAYAPTSGKLLRPVEALSAPASTSSATRTTPTLSTGGPRLLVAAYADRSGSTWTVPSGQETRHDLRRGTGGAALLVTDSGSTLLAAGDLTRSVTASTSTSARAEGALALEEYDAPVTTPPPTTEPQDPGTEAPPGWLRIPAGWARVELLVKGGATSSPPPASSTTDYDSTAYDSDDFA